MRLAGLRLPAGLEVAAAPARRLGPAPFLGGSGTVQCRHVRGPLRFTARAPLLPPAPALSAEAAVAEVSSQQVPASSAAVPSSEGGSPAAGRSRWQRLRDRRRIAKKQAAEAATASADGVPAATSKEKAPANGQAGAPPPEQPAQRQWRTQQRKAAVGGPRGSAAPQLTVQRIPGQQKPLVAGDVGGSEQPTPQQGQGQRRNSSGRWQGRQPSASLPRGQQQLRQQQGGSRESETAGQAPQQQQQQQQPGGGGEERRRPRQQQGQLRRQKQGGGGPQREQELLRQKAAEVREELHRLVAQTQDWSLGQLLQRNDTSTSRTGLSTRQRRRQAHEAAAAAAGLAEEQEQPLSAGVGGAHARSPFPPPDPQEQLQQGQGARQEGRRAGAGYSRVPGSPAATPRARGSVRPADTAFPRSEPRPGVGSAAAAAPPAIPTTEPSDAELAALLGPGAAWPPRSQPIRGVLVASGALINEQNQVLLSVRTKGARAFRGLFELPGGKVEEGETPQSALQRELHEELGVEVEVDALQPLTFVSHRYTRLHHNFLALLYVVESWRHEPRGLEGQQLVWVDAEKLMSYADRVPRPTQRLLAAVYGVMLHRERLAPGTAELQQDAGHGGNKGPTAQDGGMRGASGARRWRQWRERRRLRQESEGGEEGPVQLTPVAEAFLDA